MLDTLYIKTVAADLSILHHLTFPLVTLNVQSGHRITILTFYTKTCILDSDTVAVTTVFSWY